MGDAFKIQENLGKTGVYASRLEEKEGELHLLIKALNLKASEVFTKEILLCLCNKKVHKKSTQRGDSSAVNIRPMKTK